MGEKVAQWLERDTPLPSEWDGASLMTLVCGGNFRRFTRDYRAFSEIYKRLLAIPKDLLATLYCFCQTKEEMEQLRQYTATHSQPEIFSDQERAETLLREVESALQRTLGP